MMVFKNPELQQKFDKDGFVVISLLESDDVNKLAALYKEVQPESFKGFSSTIYNQDITLKKSTSEKIGSIVRQRIDNYFGVFRPLGSSFLCKTPGEDSIMPVHQDWTIVDESVFDSITVWMPLVDVDKRNGAMKVLPGSHKFSDALRSPTLHGVFQNIHPQIEEKMQWLKVKAGEAVVFSQALLHASPPNLSENERVIATFGLVHEQAKLSFVHRNNEGLVEQYAIDDDFFLTYNNIGQAPVNATLLKTFEYNDTLWTASDLNNAIAKHKRNNMKPLFRDPEIQQFFNQYGYAKINMLDEQDVKELFDFYHSQNLSDHSGYGFNMSIEDEDKEKVANIRKKIFEIALPKALPHLVDNAKVIAGSFVVKEKNPQGVVPPHQDWSFVENEGENYSVTCWIPLVPTNMQNGYMGVIKGSHLIYENVRPSPSPQVPTPLMNHLFTIFPYLEMYEMQPGEALIFDHRTFHASTPNLTDNPRVAIGLGFTQGDSQLRHYNMKQNGKMDTLQVYEADEEFSVIYDNSRLSKMFDKGEKIEGYKLLREQPYTYPNPTSEELLEQIKAAGNTFNVELCEHMAKLFNFNMDGSKKEEKQEEVVQETTTVDASSSNEPALPFWKVYTPLNIVREIKLRITGN
jgi:ectoine hydroxylase-related dioxygenase (phytanoyl-CoA dioxygenase family)